MYGYPRISNHLSANRTLPSYDLDRLKREEPKDLRRAGLRITYIKVTNLTLEDIHQLELAFGARDQGLIVGGSRVIPFFVWLLGFWHVRLKNMLALVNTCFSPLSK